MQTKGVALVTGAARRIGRAIAEDLSANGFTVIIHAHRSMDAAGELAARLSTDSRQAFAIAADLTDSEAAAGLVARASDFAGPVDLLVNNASLFEEDSLGSLDETIWDRHFAIHVKAPVLLAQALAAGLPEEGSGLVVNMVDQRVWRLTPHFFSYTLSKSALWTATQTMALALAPRIRVNAIGPGPTLRGPRQSDADFAAQEAGIPLEHGPDLSEFGATVRYLWENRSITGQMIALDGGQHLSWKTPDVAGVHE